MKFIIYWAFYTSSLGISSESAGRLLVYENTVEIYTIEDGYVEYNIVAKNHVHIAKTHQGERVLRKGIYLLQKDGKDVTLYIHPSFIEYSIKEDGTKHEYIRLKRKWKSRL